MRTNRQLNSERRIGLSVISDGAELSHWTCGIGTGTRTTQPYSTSKVGSKKCRPSLSWSERVTLPVKTRRSGLPDGSHRKQDRNETR